MNTKVKSILLKTLKWLLILLAALIVLSFALVLMFKYVPVYWTPLMSIRKIEARKAGTSLSIRHEWVSYADISFNLTEAVIVAEDDRFYVHNGFSEEGIRRAIREKRESGVVVHGGSTISQQTAKNVFCTNRRTFLRKGVEAYFTVLIEWMWSKDRIMEVYLNSIEMGEGVFGAQAASTTYFHHGASQLTRSEACLIAACLPNPRQWKISSPGPYINKRQATLISRCKRKAYSQPQTNR